MRLSLRAILLGVLLMPLVTGAQTWGRGYDIDSSVLGDTPVQSLSIPVLLGVTLEDLEENFGDARGGGTRSHEGLDIVAPEGTPIASPTDAIVMRTGNGSSSGLYVRTMNPGGEQFVYMHLAAIADGLSAGDIIERGDIVGFVGNTGNAIGGGAHLHFEIRKNGATDPFPRLTQTFTLAEQMRGVAQALEKGGRTYASDWSSRYADIFAAARAQGLSVPSDINTTGVAAVTPVQTTSVAPVEETSDALEFGETNSGIADLQEFLIGASKGPIAERLARTGATGYFGPLTRDALTEYQRVAGLSPTGVLDQATYIHLMAVTEGDSRDVFTDEVAVGSVSAFVRDLERGSEGEDVRTLQKLLNARGFTVAANGDGAPGQETDYFGARTEAALARFQSANSISPAIGYFGPKTRAVITQLVLN